jgi:hypothetical protein
MYVAFVKAANICIIFLGLTQQDNNVNILHNRGSLLNHYSKKKVKQFCCMESIILQALHVIMKTNIVVQT